MNRFLLDSNIVIYLLNGSPSIIKWMEQRKEKRFLVSIVSWIEVLAGSFRHKKTIAELERELKYFEIIPLRYDIARLGATLFEALYQRRKGFPRFQDGLIAATAIAENIPLITNNPKDFRRFKGLKIISPHL